VQANWGLRSVWPFSCDVVGRVASEGSGFSCRSVPSSYHNRIKADSKRGWLSEPSASCYTRIYEEKGQDGSSVFARCSTIPCNMHVRSILPAASDFQ
jgi:hypothetical protein